MTLKSGQRFLRSMTNEKVRDKKPTTFTRRETLLGSAAVLTGAACSNTTSTSQQEDAPYNASGERVGEVTDSSAIVHTRLTAAPTRNNRGYSFPVWSHNLSLEQKKLLRIPDGMDIADLEGACPGLAGRARLLYGVHPQLAQSQMTDWTEVGPETDFTHQFSIGDLTSDTVYYYAVELGANGGNEIRRGPVGHFRTAPEPSQWNPIKFFVVSCQDISCRDHPEGFRTYQSMNRLEADFVVSTGDNVYYDLDLPFATSVDIARFHWHRMYSQPLLMESFRTMSGYWLKDDHDSQQDESWSTRTPDRVGRTYQELAPVFLEQVPIGESTFRKVRWGKGLEIWFTESRDFRSPNSDPDGPRKTIWGEEQREWLKRTLLASDADFRILISPNPIVGPDTTHVGPFELPGGGADSHADGGYEFEGSDFRKWVRDNGLKNLFVINGDRHWQYHSVDPESGLREFCCGAVTDSHSVVVPENPQYHRFLRSKGGFVSVTLEGEQQQPRLLVRHHDVDGEVVFQTAI